MKRLSKKTTAILMSAMMILTCAAYPTHAFAANNYNTLGKSEDFKSFVRTDNNQRTTYYDIYGGQTEGRKDVDDLNVLMEDTLYKSKVIGTNYTPAQYWAAFANGVYAANPESYYSFNNRPYKDRFMNDVNGDRGYGNLYEALSSLTGKTQATGKNAKTCDIRTISTGKRTAKNLNQVQEDAFSLLVEVKPGRIKTSDFRKHASLKAMEEDKNANQTVMYNLMATRDRQGSTFRYIYNCFGIAYSDFSITPVSAEYNEAEKNSTGATPALRDEDTLDEALDKVKSGETIYGFSVKENASSHVASFKNESTQPATQQISTQTSISEKLSSTVSENKQVSFSQSENAKISLGSNQAFFHFETGITFTESELWGKGTSRTNETTKTETNTVTDTIQLPEHTGVTHSIMTTNYVYSMVYDCPVAISYTVTIFSYDGCYYDDAGKVASFVTSGYSQSAFMTQFKNANENLRNRMHNDPGYDESHGITRGIKVKHGDSSQSFNWDNPWIKHLDYSEISDAMKEIGIKPGYIETTTELTEKVAMSITGGTLKREGEGKLGIIGSVLPLYTLQRVKLSNANDSSQSVAPEGKLNLSTLKMSGVDAKGGAFYGFNEDRGSWILTDKDGNKLDTSDVIKLEENLNDNFIVTGLEEGTAYVKYVVDAEAYQLHSDSGDVIYVKPSDVTKTPLITINVKVGADQEDASDETSTEEQIESSGETSTEEQTEENVDIPEISDTEKEEFLEALKCEPGECSVANATLLLKNSIGADMDLTERMYVSALLQAAGDEIDGNSIQTKYEADALVWAVKEGLFADMDRGYIGSHSGITELEFAEITYRVAKKYGFDVNYEDVSGEYAGFEDLDDFEKASMNWAISKGILTEDEAASKVIRTDRIISDKEAVEFFDNNPYSI